MRCINGLHLKRHNLTLAQYKEQFPNSPIRSAAAIEKRKEAAKKTNVNRIGVPRSEDVKNKIKHTKSTKSYTAWNKGIPHTEEQKKRLSDIRKQKYETGEVTHWNLGNTTSAETKEKIRNTAVSQHRTFSDVSSQKRKETIELKKQQGWIHPSTIKFIDKLSQSSLNKLTDKDWLYEQHITNKRTISSISVELGLHWKNSHKTIKQQLIDFNIPIQYWHQVSSIQQKDIELFLEQHNISFITRSRSIIPPLELDIYIPEHNLAIEYCGLYWHSSEYKDIKYHWNKFDRCAKLGIRLLTIYSDEWLSNRELVENKIKHILNISTNNKIDARKCSISEISIQDKKNFLNTYHLQGNGPGSINLGLLCNNEIVACMSFIKQRNGIFVLNRYATSKIVRGGFSKLLSYFKKTYDWTQIISFADLRWSNGYMYKVNNFVLDKILPIDYEYVIGEERHHKFNFRHSQLSKKLINYDPALSESQNMLNHNIFKIYNCGLQRWILNNVSK